MSDTSHETDGQEYHVSGEYITHHGIPDFVEVTVTAHDEQQAIDIATHRSEWRDDVDPETIEVIQRA